MKNPGCAIFSTDSQDSNTTKLNNEDFRNTKKNSLNLQKDYTLTTVLRGKKL